MFAVRKYFCQPSTLKQHQLTHSGEKSFVCSTCEKPFSQSSHLKMHLKNHGWEKTFKCLHCDKVFFTADKLEVHTRTHTGEKPYGCHHCEKSFSVSSHLRRHQSTHPEWTIVIFSLLPSLVAFFDLVLLSGSNCLLFAFFLLLFNPSSMLPVKKSHIRETPNLLTDAGRSTKNILLKKYSNLEQLFVFKALWVGPKMHQSTSQTPPTHGRSMYAIQNNSLS